MPQVFSPRFCLVFLLCSFLAACTSLNTFYMNHQFGKAEPHERIVTHDSEAGLFFLNEVQPIIEKRCVVCHGCYDAPCQLKLSSPAGIDRGSNTDKVYNGVRLRDTEPTRLGQDAKTTAQWRERDFFPVLNEREQLAAVNRQAGLLYQLLEQKRDHPLPEGRHLPEDFDLSLNRDESCPSIESYDRHRRKNPLWGMPYGLPAIADDEMATLTEWINNGALMAYPPQPVVGLQSKIHLWERFLNQDSLKARLVARYIYEHWFLAALYFDEIADDVFFHLVRSATPPGEPIDLIATRRPFDDPGVKRVYYRLQPVNATIINKTHMPYSLNRQRMERLQTLFFDNNPNTVEQLPDYGPEAANPFKTFADLPSQSRYKFMLDEAQFTIMGFIKGPVCRGNIALNVINDHFWVYFVDPDQPLSQADEFLTVQAGNLELPARQESFRSMVRYWLNYSDRQTDYLLAKSEALEKSMESGMALDETLIWDGEGYNDNAVLTIFRHYDSASVLKGQVGQIPKTAWVVDYTLLERIHYLLVAGFDVYGNAGHQLLTRLYMDFLRLEGEFNFLALLPQEDRLRLRDYWYRDANEDTKSFLYGSRAYLNQPPGIEYQTDNPEQELHEMLGQRLQAVASDQHQLSHSKVPENHRQLLQSLQTLQGAPATLMPEASLLLIWRDDGEPLLYTLVGNRAYSNLTSLIAEHENRLPAEDNLTVTRGVATAYPLAFMQVHESDLAEFVLQISLMGQAEDYYALMDRYGIRRTSSDFWMFSDRLHHTFKAMSPVSYGLLDFNRLENR